MKLLKGNSLNFFPPKMFGQDAPGTNQTPIFMAKSCRLEKIEERNIKQMAQLLECSVNFAEHNVNFIEMITDTPSYFMEQNSNKQF